MFQAGGADDEYRALRLSDNGDPLSPLTAQNISYM